MFNELSERKTIDWSYDSTNNDWTSLDKWVEEGRPDKFIVLGVFINPHGKITKTEEGEVPYIVTKGFNIRLPLWHCKMIKMLLADQALIDGIDAGKCGAKVLQYEDPRGSLTSPSYLVRNRTLGPPLENHPETPPSSRR